jgi:hypothetical protein
MNPCGDRAQLHWSVESASSDFAASTNLLHKLKTKVPLRHTRSKLVPVRSREAPTGMRRGSVKIDRYVLSHDRVKTESEQLGFRRRVKMLPQLSLDACSDNSKPASEPQGPRHGRVLDQLIGSQQF